MSHPQAPIRYVIITCNGTDTASIVSHGIGGTLNEAADNYRANGGLHHEPYEVIALPEPMPYVTVRDDGTVQCPGTFSPHAQPATRHQIVAKQLRALLDAERFALEHRRMPVPSPTTVQRTIIMRVDGLPDLYLATSIRTVTADQAPVAFIHHSEHGDVAYRQHTITGRNGKAAPAASLYTPWTVHDHMDSRAHIAGQPPIYAGSDFPDHVIREVPADVWKSVMERGGLQAHMTSIIQRDALDLLVIDGTVWRIANEPAYAVTAGTADPVDATLPSAAWNPQLPGLHVVTSGHLQSESPGALLFTAAEYDQACAAARSMDVQTPDQCPIDVLDPTAVRLLLPGRPGHDPRIRRPYEPGRPGWGGHPHAPGRAR